MKTNSKITWPRIHMIQKCLLEKEQQKKHSLTCICCLNFSNTQWIKTNKNKSSNECVSVGHMYCKKTMDEKKIYFENL